MDPTLADTRIRGVQRVLGVADDGVWGPKSQAALDEAKRAAQTARINTVLASSFADPADVAAFRRCKKQGKTDLECFAVGDNGRGRWGDDTTKDVPMCALPPEDWEFLGSRARGASVLVTCGDKKVICELRDTMPHRKNIKNGAGIDLNPAAWSALGFTPPQLRQVTWRWMGV